MRSFIGTDKELRILGSIIEDDTIDDYIDRTQIDQEGAWGSDIEMALISHKLSINVASFNVATGIWRPGILSPNEFGEDQSIPTIYIHYTGNHFNVVLSQE